MSEHCTGIQSLLLENPQQGRVCCCVVWMFLSMEHGVISCVVSSPVREAEVGVVIIML